MLGVVLGDHLRDDMTLITFKDGAVVMHDGKVGSEQDCCCKCQCSFPFPAGVVPHVTVTVTFPSVAGDCPEGQYTTEFDLDQYFSSYTGCGNLDLGNGIVCSVSVWLLCNDGQYFSFTAVYTGACNDSGYSCTVGNGGFVGVGSDSHYKHTTVTVDGTCLPDSNLVTWHLALDIDVEYTITF